MKKINNQAIEATPYDDAGFSSFDGSYSGKNDLRFKPIQPVTISNGISERSRLASGAVLKRDRDGGNVIGYYNPLNSVGDYLWVNRKSLFGRDSEKFTREMHDALLAYEAIAAPLERDGRKGMNYDGIRVDGGGNSDAQFSVMAAKNEAIKVLAEIHAFIDTEIFEPKSKACPDGRWYSRSEMAYSNVFKALYEGFLNNKKVEDIIADIGATERPPFSTASNLELGAAMIATTAWGLLKCKVLDKFAGNNDKDTVKQKNKREACVRGKNAASFGDMRDYSIEEREQINQRADDWRMNEKKKRDARLANAAR